MIAMIGVLALWTVAVALFVLVGGELKRVEAAAKLAARHHGGGYAANSRAATGCRLADTGSPRPQASCARPLQGEAARSGVSR